MLASCGRRRRAGASPETPHPRPRTLRPTETTTMKQVVIDRYGEPEDVARCADVPDVGSPGPGEVVFDVLAFPINPADVSFCRGTYRLKPTLPATPGAEAIGRVAAVGAGVSHVRP